MRGVPVAWKILATLGAAALFGGSVTLALHGQLAIGERVTAMESWKNTTADPALRFLVCSQAAENAGRDPSLCTYLLRDIADFLNPPQGR